MHTMFRKTRRTLVLSLTAVMLAAAVFTASAAEADEIYNSLSEEQKQFDVYRGTTPIKSGASLGGLLEGSIVPDSANLDTQSYAIFNEMEPKREGDLKFYSRGGWIVWKVDSSGKPIEISAYHSYLNRVATVDNFKKSAYMAYDSSGGIVFRKPVLEPTWARICYFIPVYDINGNKTDVEFMINAENYYTIQFPDMEADYWVLSYDGKECRLNAPIEVWTNDTNGIKKTGKLFEGYNAALKAVKNSDLQPGNAEFRQESWKEKEAKPQAYVDSATNGTDNITYYYKERGADDSAYTAAVPDKAGKYTAKAVFAAKGIYREVVKTCDFEIFPQAPAPTQPESSEPESSEPESSETKQSKPEPSEPESSETKPSESEPGTPAKDTTPPVIGGVADGGIYYGEQTVKVTDENLRTVTVNGEAAAVSGNCADITLKPSEASIKIVAEDKAGNRTAYTVEVLETWVRDGITANGKKKLKQARAYKLGSGQWTVGTDSTVYSGGKTFYVKSSGEYDFKKK